MLRTRLATWEHVVTRAGAGGWQTFLDPAKLGPFLAEIRCRPAPQIAADAIDQGIAVIEETLERAERERAA